MLVLSGLYPHLGWPTRARGPYGLLRFIAGLDEALSGRLGLQRAGKGQYIDLSSWESIHAFLGPLILDTNVNAGYPRHGNLKYTAPWVYALLGKKIGLL